ncbi:toxin-antitoxin system, antitoxin component, ribbon-helix-helix domain protein [Mitsuokella sp. oral taxon 131 str. W9106]|nr:toxin-antitoxin system, antitoxin component, ribbon-helix-helix domain protein [Mitsuokella sp. oral taxon 131 str. W9106]
MLDPYTINIKRSKCRKEHIMSQRMTMDEVLKEYGVPQIKLDVHATRSELLKLREKLIAIRDLSNAREQGYLDVDCKLYIDVDDIDRYLSGELDTVGEIYAFPDDIKSYREE